MYATKGLQNQLERHHGVDLRELCGHSIRHPGELRFKALSGRSCGEGLRNVLDRCADSRQELPEACLENLGAEAFGVAAQQLR